MEIADLFGFSLLINEVDIMPLQLQINFIELREDICGLWQPRYCINLWHPWQPPSFCVQQQAHKLSSSLSEYATFPNLAEHFLNGKPFGVLWSIHY